MLSLAFYHSITLFKFLTKSPRTLKSTIPNSRIGGDSQYKLERCQRRQDKENPKQFGGIIQGRHFGLDSHVAVCLIE